MVLLKCCTQCVSKFRKLSSGQRTGIISFHTNPKEISAKECSNYRTIALISHASKVMFKILQAGLQQYINQEIKMFKLVVEKAEKLEIKLPASVGPLKRQGDSRKASTSASLTMLKPLTVWITTNCEKLLKEMEIPDHLTTSHETCMQIKKQQLELDMKQMTGSKLGKE